MKRVVRCLICNKAIGFYKGYKATLVERVKVTLTGEIKEHKLEGKLCIDCSREAGYKVRKEVKK